MESANDNNFLDVIKATDKPVLVDFWAEWCGPCRMLMPVVEELSASMSDSVLFLKVNVDESPKIASMFNIMSIPTLFLLKGEKVIATVSGFKNKDDLKKWIESNI